MQNIKSSICVVVPVYNSEKTLWQLVEQINITVGAFKESKIILVDDNSQDGSFCCMKDICNMYKNITIIKLNKNYSQQNTIMCGLNHSSCDYTVIIDDDLEQNPKDILRLYEETKLGYDVVYGINEYNKSQHRNIGSKMRDSLFYRLTDLPKGLKVSSFRIMNRKTVELIKNVQTKFVYISMEILKHTTSIGNIDIISNVKSKSNYSIIKLIKLYANIIIYYSNNKFFSMFAKKTNCYKIETVINGDALCE